jgi:hypothetical protein
MKHIFTISLCFLALSLSAQTDGWEYPFPYNPDGNADGYISLDDMLDLLAVYGQQYPESFYTDTTRAVLNLGNLGAHSCLLQAKAAGRDWRMMSDIDIPYFAQLAVNVLPPNMESDNWYNYIWFWDTKNYRPFHSQWELQWSNGTDCYYYNDCIYNADSTIVLKNLEWSGNDGAGINIIYRRECLIVSEIRPEYEYSYCSAQNSEQDGIFKDCIESKLQEGWIPWQGGSHNWFAQYQGFWRIKD